MDTSKLVTSILVGASVGTVAYFVTDKKVRKEIKNMITDASDKMKKEVKDINK